MQKSGQNRLKMLTEHILIRMCSVFLSGKKNGSSIFVKRNWKLSKKEYCIHNNL